MLCSSGSTAPHNLELRCKWIKTWKGELISSMLCSRAARTMVRWGLQCSMRCSIAVIQCSVFVCSCSVAVLSGLRPHEGSEERESYHLSDEVADFPRQIWDHANRKISTVQSETTRIAWPRESPDSSYFCFIKQALQTRQLFQCYLPSIPGPSNEDTSACSNYRHRNITIFEVLKNASQRDIINCRQPCHDNAL